jgi:Protein of unknown function (DUF3300)/Chaperone of endosialidase
MMSTVLASMRLLVATLLLLVSLEAVAQTPQPVAAPAQPLLKAAELDQLLAPIALYSDPLLTQVLIAATYPLEVVQADRWVKSNPNRKGGALSAALAKQSWDDSIKSLVEVPTVLAMMGEQLDWTQKLGDAMLAQQADVMDSIQRLRVRAQANGKLKTTKEQTVTVKTEDQNQYVVIEPTSPTELYVPYYEPAVVYGTWPYPDYAPYFFPPPSGYLAAGALATGIAFATGIAVRHAIWGDCDWGRHNINVLNKNVNINNINRNDRTNFSNWQHNADHRHGVKYNSADVRQKYAKTDVQAGKAARQDFRGKEGQQVLDPGRDRPGGADRDRPGAGDRDRPGAGDRDHPGAGDRDRPAAGRDDGARDRPGGGASKGSSKQAGPKQAGPKQAGPKQAGPKQAGPKQADRAPGGGQKASPRSSPQPSAKPSQPKRDTAFSNVQSGPATRAQADRGRQSYGGGGGGRPVAATGGGGRGGGGGGGRRSDVALKHDIILLSRLDNGLGFYRFSYNGSERAYVGVIAQEVQTVVPEAVVRGRDGYLRVFYDKLGLEFQTYDRWIASGARLPTASWMRH